ncbi:ParB N-terminal domain-containing protein [Nesterenkonia sp. CL21]|uniref:ParB N-terminal domain-containing protein n=1 Tax=Nesterenkonia sp. CL21 TaxID=3064894 RepID=UPI00287B482A|nr:ParB N-terminal domain-containing protein [Nesterenkonia sp. CL21]MDS2171834.1 ParB N-terminal domain-containing protein [Nesterenkonia sp. CL21]
MSGGYLEMKRAVSSIRVGARHRKDLGDIDALAESIDQHGLLQTITIAPDGLLVCGRRRLEAIRRLHWRTVNPWVRQGLSDRLGQLLSENDDNLLHKALTPLEAAGLYRELKEVLAEDAARRQEATRFKAPGPEAAGGVDGGGNFPAPSTPAGETRQQAAAMIPGAASYRTLDKIEFVQQAALREDLPAEAHAQIADALARIEAGAPVHPIFEEVRAVAGDPCRSKDAELDALAQEAIARVTAKPSRRKQPPVAAVAGMTVWTTRSFLVIWGELTGWWTHYDPAQLARELSDEQIEQFLAIADGTTQFAADLAQARDRAHDSGDGGSANAGEGGVRHLRAL